MPRHKGRNALGSVTRIETTIAGRKAIRYDAKKRYTKPDGTPGRKFRRCLTANEAYATLSDFAIEIENEKAATNNIVVQYTTYEEAIAALRQLESRIANEFSRDVAPVTIKTFFELLDYYRSEFMHPAVIIDGIQVSGYRQNLATIEYFIKEYREHLGDIPLSDITFAVLQKMVKKMLTTPRKAGGKKPGVDAKELPPPKRSTVNRKMAVLRRILETAVEAGWLTQNPFNKKGKFRLIDKKAERPRNRILTFKEESALLAACDGPDVCVYKRGNKVVTSVRQVNPRSHIKPIIVMALDTGMRKREIFTTTRSQVDLNTLVIELNDVQTKALNRRFIPITDRLAGELQKLFQTPGGPKKPDDLLFGGVKDCDRAFASACRRAGIKDFRFHDLRHTAATWIDQADVPPAARLNIVGHADDRTAQGYTNVSSDTLTLARDRMNKYRQSIESLMKE